MDGVRTLHLWLVDTMEQQSSAMQPLTGWEIGQSPRATSLGGVSVTSAFWLSVQSWWTHGHSPEVGRNSLHRSGRLRLGPAEDMGTCSHVAYGKASCLLLTLEL